MADEPLIQSTGWLVYGAARWFAHELEEALRHYDIGWRDYCVLAVLESMEPMSQQAIGQRLGIDRSTMTHVIDGLEQRKLVVRARDRADRRAYSIALSDAGQMLIGDVIHPISADVHEGFAGKLSPDDRLLLNRLLASLPQH